MRSGSLTPLAEDGGLRESSRNTNTAPVLVQTTVSRDSGDNCTREMVELGEIFLMTAGSSITAAMSMVRSWMVLGKSAAIDVGLTPASNWELIS